MSEAVQLGETPTEPEVEQVETPEVEQPEEEFDKERAMATIKNLREIEKQAKRDAKELERLRKAEEERKLAEMSEIDRLKAERDDLAAKYEATRIENLKRQIAAEVGLPEALTMRIAGTTEEELRADAQTLAASIPKVQKQAGGSATNPGANHLAGETDDQRRQRLFGPHKMGV